MKRIIPIFYTAFILIAALTGVSEAITVSAAPNPVTVNNPTTISTLTTFTFSMFTPCTIEANFTSGGPYSDVGTCPAFSANCPLNISHTYTVPGIYTVTARAKAGFCDTSFIVGPTSANTTVTVNCAALTTATPAPPPAGTVGTPYSYATSLVAGGQLPRTYSISAGALPPGLTLNTATGAVTGTPTTGGNFNATIRATDSCPLGAQTYDTPLTFTISCAPMSLSSTVLPNASVGQPYSYQLPVAGGLAPYGGSITAGTLPPGLTYNAATHTISGTPTGTGTYSFTVNITSGCPIAQPPINASLSLTVTPCPALTITTASLPNGAVSQPYSRQIMTSGGQGTISFGLASGSLPAGLTISAGGLISGTPASAGLSNFTVRATDSCPSGSQTATQPLSLLIACQTLSFASPATLTSGTTGSPYSYQLLTSGGQVPVTYSLVSGSLPAGLALSPTGLISGTTSDTGTYTFTVQATDSCSPSAQSIQKTFTLLFQTGAVTCPQLSLVSPSVLPEVKKGQPYSYQLLTSGGTPPVTFMLAGGMLPAGLTIAANGMISGVPTSAGDFSFAVRATDSCSSAQSVQSSFSLRVTEQPGGVSVTALPASLAIPRGQASAVSLFYQFTGPVSAPFEISSQGGTFIVDGAVIESNPVPLKAMLVNGAAVIPEGLTVPVRVIERTINRNTTRFSYVRTFTSAGVTLTATVRFDITTEAASGFSISRMELYFKQDGTGERKSYVEVFQRDRGLRAYVDLRYNGSGILEGFWEVDGRVLNNVYQPLTHGGNVTLITPEIPPLPTFDPGTHVLRFVITQPLTEISLPSISYFVIAETGRVTPGPIRLTSPADKAAEEYGTAKFAWEPQSGMGLYSVQYFDGPGATVPLFSAMTRETSYQLPNAVAKKTFAAGRTYLWKVTGFDKQNRVAGESGLAEFTFK